MRSDKFIPGKICGSDPHAITTLLVEKTSDFPD